MSSTPGRRRKARIGLNTSTPVGAAFTVRMAAEQAAGVAFADASIQAETVQMSATVAAGVQLTIDQTAALASWIGAIAPAWATFYTNEATARAAAITAAETASRCSSKASGRCIRPP